MVGRRQVEFVSLELVDFRCFRGRQRFQLEPPTADGRSGVTLVTGWGAKGKTVFVDALELVLWGVRQQRKSPRRRCRVARPMGSEALHQPDWFIHCDVLKGPDPQAAATLTVRVTEPGGARWTLEIERRWTLQRDGWITESVQAAAHRAGSTERLVAAAAQRAIDGVLPPGTPPLIFVEGDQIDVLSCLASMRHDVREEAEVMLARMVGEWPDEMWRSAAGPVIKAANLMLAGCREPNEVWLLPDEAGRLWHGAYPMAPGIWATDESVGNSQLVCIGLALVLGPHLAGEVSAPLVLDAPVNRMEPSAASAWLEALVGAVVPQVIIASHAELLHYPAMTLLDRVRWIQLIAANRPDYYGVNVLDETALTGGGR